MKIIHIKSKNSIYVFGKTIFISKDIINEVYNYINKDHVLELICYRYYRIDNIIGSKIAFLILNNVNDNMENKLDEAKEYLQLSLLDPKEILPIN